MMKFVSLMLALWLQVPATTNAPIIDDIQVRGNKRIQSSTIKFNILSKKGDALNPNMIRRDVRAIYGLRQQFDDVSVETEETTPGHVILIFNVSEKPTIRNIEYKGLSS